MVMNEWIRSTDRCLTAHDPEIAAAVRAELAREQDGLELIASENVVSEAVLAAAGSVLTNKYAEGYPAHRYYGGCGCVDVAENLAIERAKALFGAAYANVQPHSGSQANTAVYVALLHAGDTVMGMSLADGGHLTHGSPVNLSGLYYHFVPYGVDTVTHRIDYDKLEAQAKEVRPKLIVAGASAYPRVIDFPRMAEIAHSVGALLMVDMAHIAGLVAAGEHPSPLPYADVVTTTTHKTLRGPRGGLILTNNEDIAKKVNKAIFPGIQGGPLEHIIAAKAVCFGEALKPEFRDYQHRIVRNARALADALLAEGFDLVVRRNRQPSDAGRSAPHGRHRQGDGVAAGRGSHHGQQERHSQRSREALRDLRHPGGYARRHHARFDRGGHGNRRAPHQAHRL